MLIIPGLYIERGKAVSFYKGHDNEQKKTYRKSPLNLAREFQAQGASLLHLTDLDGSTNGEPINLKLIGQICDALMIPVEVGGGIRTIRDIKILFELGVSRVILGVSALNLIPQALDQYGPECIVFGIKARQHRVESDSLPPESDEVVEIAEQAAALGIRNIVYKDMEKEGTLYHPNYDDVDRLIALLKSVNIFSSGGIVALDDLRILDEIGAKGALISRAFIEHELSLAECREMYETQTDRAFASACFRSHTR